MKAILSIIFFMFAFLLFAPTAEAQYVTKNDTIRVGKKEVGTSSELTYVNSTYATVIHRVLFEPKKAGAYLTVRYGSNTYTVQNNLTESPNNINSDNLFLPFILQRGDTARFQSSYGKAIFFYELKPAFSGTH